MYKFLSSLLFICLFAGCATNRPILLDSSLHSQSPQPVNPALTLPAKGLHPYLGASVGGASAAPSDNSFGRGDLGILGGLLLQTSLENDLALASFASLTTRFVYSQVRFSPNKYSLEKLTPEQEALFSSKKDSFAGDLGIRIGLTGRVKGAALSVYGLGLAQYEDGEYFDFRKQVDNLGNYYNLSTEKLTFGYGYGGDLSFGNTREWDMGLIVEYRGIFSSSQSFESSYEEEEGPPVSYGVTTVEGGAALHLRGLKLAFYYDWGKFRLAVALDGSSSGCTTLTYIYRW